MNTTTIIAANFGKVSFSLAVMHSNKKSLALSQTQTHTTRDARSATYFHSIRVWKHQWAPMFGKLRCEYISYEFSTVGLVSLSGIYFYFSVNNTCANALCVRCRLSIHICNIHCTLAQEPNVLFSVRTKHSINSLAGFEEKILCILKLS